MPFDCWNRLSSKVGLVPGHARRPANIRILDIGGESSFAGRAVYPPGGSIQLST